MFSATITATRQRVKGAAKRSIGSIVSTASNAYYGRWYYSNRWHPHHALLENALAESEYDLVQCGRQQRVRREQVQETGPLLFANDEVFGCKLNSGFLTFVRWRTEWTGRRVGRWGSGVRGSAIRLAR